MDRDMLMEAIQHFTVARVTNYLKYIFKCDDDEIILLTKRGSEAPIPIIGSNAISTSGAELGAMNPTALAGRVRIWFWGGPPEELDWYRGTYLSILVDRFFRALINNDNDAIRQFIGAVQKANTQSHSETLSLSA